MIGQKNTNVFWHQSEARTAATVWNWSGKTLFPGALLAVLYFSSLCHIFPPVWTFPRTYYLPLGLQGCDARCYNELLSGFVQGFRLHFQVAQLGQFSSNLCSAFQHPDIVDNELRSEICEERTRGPFEHHPIVNLRFPS